MQVKILGVKFNSINLDKTVAKIEAMIKRGGFYQVGTMNPEYVVRAQNDKVLMNAIQNMDLIVPDGIGIVIAARLKKRGRLARITGRQLVSALVEFCARKGYKVGLVGGEKGIAEQALKVLQERCPNLKGYADSRPVHSGGGLGRPPREWEKVIKRIRKEKPQILLTALSFKGPIWLESLRDKKLDLVGIEVGGLFNYLTGCARRPPKIVQKIGLEWLWRLFWEPWRFKRQLALLKFFFLLFRLDT